MEIGEAGKILNNIGLKYTIEYVQATDRSKVIDQFPLPGTEVQEGSIIDLYLKQKEEAEIQVPYLVGKNREEIIQTLEDMSLNYEFKGQGSAISQDPLPGENITKNEKIMVEFGEMEE